MANVWAIKTGLWSDPTVWNTGSLPTASDDVYANGFTVTIAANRTVLSLRTESASGINAGGGFTCATDGVTITANVIAGTTQCLSVSGNNCTVVGNPTGGTATNTFGLVVTGTNFSLVGTPTGGIGVNSHGLYTTVTVTINVTGNPTGGSSSGCGVFNNALATITIVGNVTGGGIATSYGANNGGAGSIIVLGSAIPSSAAPGLRNAAAGTVRCNIAIATNLTVSIVPAVISIDSNGLATVREMEYGSKGQSPVAGYVKFQTGYDPKVKVTRQSGSVAATDYAAIVAELPAVGNVRFGTTYNSGSRVGTVRIPVASNVRSGIPVGNAEGTALLEAGQVWARLAADITEAGSIGERLKNAGTVDTIGAIVASLIHQ